MDFGIQRHFASPKKERSISVQRVRPNRLESNRFGQTNYHNVPVGGEMKTYGLALDGTTLVHSRCSFPSFPQQKARSGTSFSQWSMRPQRGHGPTAFCAGEISAGFRNLV
jgi:hypothetical protein